MKRDIKFRAWNGRAKQMAQYVTAIQMGDTQGTPSSVNVIVNGHNETWEVEHDKVELLQYTGLKDKNGREIYEGDLFEHRFGYTVFDDPPHAEMGTEYGVVTFDNGQFGVKIQGLGVYNLCGLLSQDGHLDNMPKDDLFVMKIAGNIHSNPELLEDK